MSLKASIGTVAQFVSMERWGRKREREGGAWGITQVMIIRWQASAAAKAHLHSISLANAIRGASNDCEPAPNVLETLQVWGGGRVSCRGQLHA